MVIIAKLACPSGVPGFSSFLYDLSSLDGVCADCHVSRGSKSISLSGQLMNILAFGISQLNVDVLRQLFQDQLLKEQARVVVSQEC